MLQDARSGYLKIMGEETSIQTLLAANNSAPHTRPNYSVERSQGTAAQVDARGATCSRGA